MIGIRSLFSNNSDGSGRFLSDAGRGGIAVVGAVLAVTCVAATGRVAIGVSAQVTPIEVATTLGSHVPTSDIWTERLTDPRAWRNGRFHGRHRALSRDEERREREEEARQEREERLREQREAREERLREEMEARQEALERAREFGRERGTYRTVCVRTCDGYFFPISFSTTPDRFASDEAACRSRCASSARLYVYPNPGAEPERMVNLSGQPYSALKTAFLFRTSYDAGCTCKPHPWDKEALDRHRAFADVQKGRKAGNTRTVARTVRSDVPIAAPSEAAPAATTSASPDERLQRPEGVMLLGASETPKSSKRSAPEVRSRSTGGNARSSVSRSHWSQRAFRGD